MERASSAATITPSVSASTEGRGYLSRPNWSNFIIRFETRFHAEMLEITPLRARIAVGLPVPCSAQARLGSVEFFRDRKF